MKISIEMEPRELHELIMLGVATMGPDLTEPPTPVNAERPKAIEAKPKSASHMKRARKAADTYLASLPAPTKVIRAWAKEQGMHPPKGGMLPQDIIEAFRRAHAA